jgi:hypothetical protein
VKGELLAASAEGRLVRWFCLSAGLILLLTGLAKVLSTLGISRMLDVVDPVFGLKFRHLFMGVGLLELRAAFLILLTDSRPLHPQVVGRKCWTTSPRFGRNGA